MTEETTKLQAGTVAIYKPQGPEDHAGLRAGQSLKIVEHDSGWVRVEAPKGNLFAVDGTLLIYPENLIPDDEV